MDGFRERMDGTRTVQCRWRDEAMLHELWQRRLDVVRVPSGETHHIWVPRDPFVRRPEERHVRALWVRRVFLPIGVLLEARFHSPHVPRVHLLVRLGRPGRLRGRHRGARKLESSVLDEK